MDGLERGSMSVKEDNRVHWSTSQLKFGTQELSYMAKTGSSHPQMEVGQQHKSSRNQQWQHLGSDLCNIVRDSPIVTSKYTKDEEYSDCEDESDKKGVLIEKGDVSQKMEGKSNDCKTSTLRSKHSATEQRRRCKINDRFQMLRQLVPNTDQKRDKASFLLEVIEYIQVLQEKLRKYESTEHGQHQERLKTIAWDLPQRNSGLQDFTSIVSTLPSDWKKSVDHQLGRPRSTSAVPAVEYGSMGDMSLQVDRAIEDSQYSHPDLEKVSISKTIPVSLCAQLPVHIPYGRNANLPNICVLQSVTESKTSSHVRLDDEKVVTLSSNKVEISSPMPHEKSPAPAQLRWGMNEEWQHHLETKKYLFSQCDANGEVCSKDSANGKGSSGLELEPSVAGSSLGLLQNNGADVSQHRGGVNPTTFHRPETIQRARTSQSLQEPMFLQGHNVDVSSLYSQKLQNILAEEFQSSGLDLSKTSISVQINFREAASKSTEVDQQSTRRGKHPAPQALDDFNKRPKIVSES